MKKFTIIALALCVGFMLALPAMALEIENNGLLRVRGFSASGYKFDETRGSSDSYYDMRFRLNTKFVVADGLYAQTRLRAMNGTVMGSATPAGSANIQWERAWLSAMTPIGRFQAGRMISGAWGTSFVDSEGQQFRVRFDSAAGPVKYGVIAAKIVEGDIGPDISSGDANVYYGYGVYPSETVTAGLLYAYQDLKHFSDIGAGQWKALVHALLPFFKANIGDAFKIQGELRYNFGDFQNFYDNTPDTDTDSMAYNLEGTFNFGGGSAQLGYAYASGQDTSTDDTSFHVGNDWEKLWILTGSTGPAVGTLGTQGNFSADGGNDDGIKLIYGGASFNLGEAMTLGVVAGIGTADETATGQDDDLGVEVDLQFGWKFYDGALAYSAVAAYLSAGDYWEQGIAPADYDDSCYVLYHKIQINF